MTHLTRRQKSQCALWALDRVNLLGGHLVICKSDHWYIPHVMHFCADQGLTHFVPHADLKAAWYSIFGFHGQVLTFDASDRKPLSKPGLIVGTVLLVCIAFLWAIHRQFLKQPNPNP